ncbi:MAG: SDR family NAD(P)-dependent oxidoreductase [Bacteroidetes bacterium]|nr:SDR family NAD(P)-dependent oxidoreductase [Bacteroidota bacterium]
MNKSKIIFITGATSGFGKAIAEKFAAHNFDCIITGRREDILKEVAKDLETRYGVRVLPLVFDVCDRELTFEKIQLLPEEWQHIDILVNNAGLALGRESFETASMEDWDIMVDTNVKGLLNVSRAVLPFMIENKRGHIINIGSTAAKEVYPNGNIYCASKHAVDAISKAQRIDLLPYGIKVTGIHPGAAETAFSIVRFKGDVEKAKSVYDGYEPLHAEDIADVCYYCSTLPDHVCINDLVITCTSQANSYLIKKNGV